MQFLLYLGLAGCSLTGIYTGVRYSRGTRGVFSLALSSCITCIIASVFFLSLTGFRPVFNSITLLYAVIFAACCLLSQYCGVAVYRHTDVAGSGMVRDAMSLLLKCTVGVWLFRESVTVVTALRILCMLGASVAVFFETRHIQLGKWTLFGWLLSAVIVLNNVLSTVISKYYAIDSRVTDSRSYFLLVNLLCLVFSVIMVMAIQHGNARNCVAELRKIRPKQYAYIVANTISSNISSLLTVAILAGGDILLYSPLTSGIGILTAQIVAVIFEKEKFMPIPVLLSLTAAVLSFWR